MVAQEEPAIVHVVNDVLRAGIGMVGRRNVIEHQQNARDCLHDEDEQENRPEDIGPAGAAGNGLVEHLGLKRFQADSLVNEVEDLFDGRGLVVSAGLQRLHQTIRTCALVPALNSMSMMVISPAAVT